MTDLSKCPECGGEADNGHDRCMPPNVYLCSKCQDTPTEKVATAKVEQEAVIDTLFALHQSGFDGNCDLDKFRELMHGVIGKALTQTIEECEASKRELVAEVLEIIPEHQGGRLKLWADIRAIAAKYLTSEVSE